MHGRLRAAASAGDVSSENYPGEVGSAYGWVQSVINSMNFDDAQRQNDLAANERTILSILGGSFTTVPVIEGAGGATLKALQNLYAASNSQLRSDISSADPLGTYVNGQHAFAEITKNSSLATTEGLLDSKTIPPMR